VKLNYITDLVYRLCHLGDTFSMERGVHAALNATM